MITLLLLVQAPCFCVAASQVEKVSTHSCCPQARTPPVAERLQATCSHCDAIAQIPTLELTQVFPADFAQPLFFVLHIFSTPESFVFKMHPDFMVPPAHAPPVFISQARFIA